MAALRHLGGRMRGAHPRRAPCWAARPAARKGAPLAIRETGEYDRAAHNTSGYALPNFARAPLGAAFHGARARARFRVVAHQTRHPLKTVLSRANRVGMMYAPVAYSNPYLFRDVLGHAPGFPPPVNRSGSGTETLQEAF